MKLILLEFIPEELGPRDPLRLPLDEVDNAWDKPSAASSNSEMEKKNQIDLT